MEGSGVDLPLADLKVIDAASLFAGPVIGMYLGDFGADVIKIEHPAGDNLRGFGWSKDGVSMWWSVVGRNKRSVTLKLSDPRGAEAARRLIADADVFIENFRTGTLERWGLGWEELHELNPGLVMVRTTGFGQTGPYSRRPGFGTLAEAMSGFAEVNGYADSPPTLPPLALADSVAALVGTCAIFTALHWRGKTGEGQMIDLSITEPLFWLLGAQVSTYDQLGIEQGRSGNRAPFTCPRNAYQARDGRWLVISGSSQSIAERIMATVGRPDIAELDWFGSHTGRLAHQDLLDEVIGGWVAQRDRDEALLAFEEHEAAAGPIYSVAEILDDPQFKAREATTVVDHDVLGPLRMQNVVPRLSASPGRVRTPGPALGAHNTEILQGELGMSDEELASLGAAGVVVPAE